MKLILPSVVLSLFCIGFLATVAGGANVDGRAVRQQIDHLNQPTLSKDEALKTIVALAEMGNGAKEAVPELQKLIDDPSRSLVVRGHACWAIEQITPWKEEAREYHVAAENPAADDANPGTAERPWKTIQKAAQTLRPGDTVLIHNGAYREMVRPFLGGTADARMITYKAAAGEHPIIKGSDLWKTEWKSQGDGIWSTPYQRHAWDHPEKWKTPKQGPRYRCEQVFVDGELLTHVATRDELHRPGTFYTADDGDAGTLYIHPKGNMPPEQRIIERSMRQHCFYPAVKGLGYVHVQGLTMQHAAAPEFSKDWGAIGTRPILSVRYGNHWLIEDNTVEWGNAQGIDVGAWSWGQDGGDEPIVGKIFGYHIVRRNCANHNGVSGITGTDGINHILFEDNETAYNGYKGNFWGFEVAGLKVHNAKNCTLIGNYSHDNEGFGIWLDWNCLNNRITQCISTHNRGGGLFVEASDGPNLLDCNVIIGTREAPPPETPNVPWADGIYGNDTNRLVAVFNYIEGSEGFAVRLRDLFGRIGPGDRPTTSSHNRIYNNYLLNSGRGAVCFNPQVPLAQDNKSDYNVLGPKNGKVMFQLENGGSNVDWPKTAIGQALNLSGNVNADMALDLWRSVLHQDEHSTVVGGEKVFAGLSPEQIRDRLMAMAGDLKMPKDENDIQPRPVAELLAAMAPARRDQKAEPSEKGQVLYNGIELPSKWPPEIRHLGIDPMPVPYLQSPPKVIPIDIGRQLFVDDFLIEQTTLKRTFHQATLYSGNPVLKPDKPWEAKQNQPKDPPQAMPFSDGVWFDPRDQMFKMWYMAGWNNSTCYAISKDGLRWRKPSLDVVPGTNIVQPQKRDSATIWIDQFEKNPQRRFKMMRRNDDNSLHEIHFSSDGIHWSKGQPAGNAFDRSTFFYNPFRQVWVLSLRGDSIWEGRETADPSLKPRYTKGHWIGIERFRRYVEGPDLLAAAQSWPTKPVKDEDPGSFEHWHDPTMWVWPDRLDLPRPDIGVRPEMYTVDGVGYESIMLGLFSIWQGNPKNYPMRGKINQIELGFSRDGFHWDRPWRQPVIGVSEDPNAWNYSNVQSAGGCCLIVGDRLYFYASGHMVRDITKRKGFSSTGLAMMRRDGFASMDTAEGEGMLLTRPIRFTGKHLFVNVDNPQGELRVEVLDEGGNVLTPFDLDHCLPVKADSTIQPVKWRDAEDLSAVAGKPVRLRFHLSRGELYAFWISPDAGGASRGFVAAGGPGFTGPTDTVGMNGYTAARGQP